MSELTAKDLHWFRLANANPTVEFYAFKDRFMRRYGVFNGYDLQIIEKECWTCNGTGLYRGFEYQVTCNRCFFGVFDYREVWLERWVVGDRAYHKPVTDYNQQHELRLARLSDKPLTPVKIIHGIIPKGIRKPHPLAPLWPDVLEPVAQAVAYRAYLRLLLRHEPKNYYWHMVGRVKHWVSAHKVRMVFCLMRLRNRMDLFKSLPEQQEEELPF